MDLARQLHLLLPIRRTLHQFGSQAIGTADTQIAREEPIMSRTSSQDRQVPQNVKQACRRMQTSWSNSERSRRQTVASRRQQALWQLLACTDPGSTGEPEILAIGAPTIADLGDLLASTKPNRDVFT